MAYSDDEIEVFISVKNLDEDGNPTRDSRIARELHQVLMDQGISSFLSLVSLESMGTAEYKGVIDDALDRAPVLVAVGTSPENIASRWVRYEWDSFCNDIISGIKPEGKVFSLISGFPVTKLPRALRQNQAFEYESRGVQHLSRFLSNALALRQAVEDRDHAETLRDKAEQAQQLATQEAEKARRIADFLVGLFEVSNPSEARGNSITARELLDKGAADIQTELADQPLIQASFMDTIGKVYINLGLQAEAAPLLMSALDVRRSLLGDEHPDTLMSMHHLGLLYQAQGNYEAAETIALETLNARDKVLGIDHPDTISSLNTLAVIYITLRKDEQAVELAAKNVEASRRVFGDLHEYTLTTIANAANLYVKVGRHGEAETLLVDSLAVRRNELGSEHPATIYAIGLLAYALKEQARYEEAEPLYVEGLELCRKVFGDDHPRTLAALNNLAGLYDRQARYDRAEPLYLDALQNQRRTLGPDHPETAITMHNLALLYRETGRLEQSRDFFEQTLTVDEKTYGPDHPLVAEDLKEYAILLRKIGNETLAAELEARIKAIDSPRKTL